MRQIQKVYEKPCCNRRHNHIGTDFSQTAKSRRKNTETSAVPHLKKLSDTQRSGFTETIGTVSGHTEKESERHKNIVPERQRKSGAVMLFDIRFDGLNTSAAAADGMFAQTFYDCTSLTGPAAKMSAANGGQYLHKIWPMTGATMQTYTGTNIDGLRAIPVSWGGEGVLDCVAGTYQSADETECLTCALGAFCVGGLAPQETCADGTYADETGLAECKACDKLYGVGASSSLPRTSINNCYIPKDVGLSDGKGSFSFIENCQYQ